MIDLELKQIVDYVFWFCWNRWILMIFSPHRSLSNAWQILYDGQGYVGQLHRVSESRNPHWPCTVQACAHYFPWLMIKSVLKSAYDQISKDVYGKQESIGHCVAPKEHKMHTVCTFLLAPCIFALFWSLRLANVQ